MLNPSHLPNLLSLQGSVSVHQVCVCSVSQLCLTLCDSADCSPPGFSVHGVFQVNTGVGCYFVLQGNLPDPGIEPVSPALAGDSLPLCHLGRVYHLRQRVRLFLEPFLPPIPYVPRPAKCCNKYITP